MTCGAVKATQAMNATLWSNTSGFRGPGPSSKSATPVTNTARVKNTTDGGNPRNTVRVMKRDGFLMNRLGEDVCLVRGRGDLCDRLVERRAPGTTE